MPVLSVKTAIKLNLSVIFALMVCFTMGTSCTSSYTQNAENPEEAEASRSVFSVPQYSIGEIAPDFNLADLHGNKVSLNSLKGKMVVIHFATTWCPFCNAEAPYLEEINQAYKEKGVQVLIIDVKEEQKLVKKKLQDRFNFTFPVLLDPDGVIAASYAPEGVLPDLTRDEVVLASNILIDREGRFQFYSLLDSQNFDAELIALKKRIHDLL